MSEPKKPEPGSEAKPELTPAEQAQQDQERVQGQLIVTDVTRQMQGVMEAFGFGGSGSSGRTSFEGHELNAMIDLIENSNPEHLEEAGQALLKARTAIGDAAKELKDFIAAVDWEGESGTAFRDWGNGLVAHATKLGEFAQTAGTQITVAGTGLASVRNSLPPRDTRLNRKSPDEIETPKRIDGNPEYAAALKVEKDRQEAINQANRLASYYAVSEETLAAQEPPRFDKKLDVEMPRPSGRIREDAGSGSSAGSESAGSGRSQAVPEHAAIGSQGPAASSHGYEAPAAVAPVPDKSISTEIDSVATPPAPVTASGPSPTTAPAGPVGPAGGPNLTPPLATGFVNPVTSKSRVPHAATGAPKAVGQTGFGGPRASGPTVGGPAANGRTGPPVGRPAPVSGGPASGRGGPQPPTAGRSGVTGGRPMAAGHAGTSGATGPRAGRATSGIVGGTPQRAVPGGATPGGARGVPRGTVIGAGGAARPGGPVGGVGQRGVVGAGGTSSASRPGGRGTPSTNGVVGTPRGGAVGSGAGAKGFTAGGAGLVRGPAGRRDSEDEDQDAGTPRPDYLTEDRETWEAGRRGVAPPVIE
ncbi:hypothetical protein [Streptomyces sp. NPDC060022]|uniref:WXG100 family type VII secretion target n=1 Tax=Streptomyces sp. NPDC060022 TaxID=3347039 RepID=UPI00367ABF25